jgi:tetratricopeptide (TPR) repeat protein
MPLVLFGWLWFVVTLIPMIGLIHVGGQAMADRYTYFTTIGLLIIFVWCGEKLCERFGAPRNVTVTIAVLLVLAYSVAAWSQVSYWRDSRTLYNRTLQISPSNYMAMAQLGELLRIDNRFSEAIPYYNQSLQIAPFQYRIFNNIATCYMNIGYVESAVPYLREATRLAPNYLDAHFNLAVALASVRLTDEAIAEYRTVIALSPNDAEAYFQLGECLEALGKLAEAKEQYLMVVRIDPSHRRGANAVSRLAR